MTRNGLCGLLVATALVLTAGPSVGGNASEARKQAESSMLVTGTVVIGEDGSILAHEIDPKIELPAPLRELVANAAGRWKFEPVKVDGRVVRAKVPMSLRLVAKRLDDGGLQVTLSSAHFGAMELPRDEVATVDKRIVPAYPRSAISMRGRGTVYMLVRIGRDGRVIDVAAEQVNLRVVGTSQQMDLLRRDFAQTCTNALRKWTFKPPLRGPEADRKEWVGRIAFDFRLPEEGAWAPGKWDTYVPGPRNRAIPWADDKLRTAGSPDAMPDGGFQTLGSGPRLLNPEAG